MAAETALRIATVAVLALLLAGVLVALRLRRPARVAEEARLGLWQHVEELRRRVLVVAGVLMAGLAIALTVGFYALALGMCAALLGLDYLLLFEGRFGLFGLKILLFSLIGIGTILFSVIPRREKFEPPGSLLAAQDFPGLFAMFQDIADKTGQAMPAEVYLLPDLNAFVLERGGTLGYGRTRVLGVGLSLLQILTVEELRAVIAHEFGHFHGGDTRMGPWIHKTRAAIGRTLQGLQRQNAILSKPFEWYGLLFLRTTLSVSRHQELAADRLGAQIAGREAMASGLKMVHSHGPLNSAFWSQEVAPAVRKGFRPALADGFQAFLMSPEISVLAPKILEDVLKEEKADPYDSHPCLRDRLASLGIAVAPVPAVAGPKAITLLQGHDGLEAGLFGSQMGIDPSTLNPLRWDESGEKVHRPMLEDFLKPYAEKLSDLRFQDYPLYLADPALVLDRLKDVFHAPDELEARRSFIANILVARLILALCSQGWRLESSPGSELICRPAPAHTMGRDASITMGGLRKELIAGVPAEAWSLRSRAWGLA